MKCPVCGEDMVDGEATVRGTPWGFFFFGFSHQHLWFRDESGGREVVVRSNDTVPACRCPKCRLAVVAEERTLEERLTKAGRKIARAFNLEDQHREQERP